MYIILYITTVMQTSLCQIHNEFTKITVSVQYIKKTLTGDSMDFNSISVN